MTEVIFEKKGHIAFVRLNRPESLNAINRRMADSLIECWRQIRDDMDLWVGIVSGTGPSFCSGADVKEMAHGCWKFSDSILFGDKPMGPDNYGVWKPLIAATQGHVNGAGLWLALQCDIRIASENALYGTRETRVNVPALIAPFLSRYMPRAIAAELIYTARPISAQRAYQLGLVNRIASEERLLEEATALAELICECGPLSVWASKEMTLRGESMDFRSALALVEQVATPIWNSQDSIEAKEAFLEKRNPVWKLK